MPRLTPSSRARVRHRIEESAVRLFVEKGYAATSIRAIAASAQITPGALYNHYASKESLFASIAQASQRLLLSDPENRVATLVQDTRFPDDLLELADAIDHLIARHKTHWLLWYVDVIEFGGKHFKGNLTPEALVGVPSLQRRFVALRKEKRLHLDPELAFSMAYMHLFNYFLVEHLFGGRNHYGVAKQQAVSKIVEVLRRGFLR